MQRERGERGEGWEERGSERKRENYCCTTTITKEGLVL